MRGIISGLPHHWLTPQTDSFSHDTLTRTHASVATPDLWICPTITTGRLACNRPYRRNSNYRLRYVGEHSALNRLRLIIPSSDTLGVARVEQRTETFAANRSECQQRGSDYRSGIDVSSAFLFSRQLTLELTVNARTVIRTPLLTLRTICRKVSVRCSTRATPKVSLEGIIKRNRFSPESINRSIT